MFNKVNGRQLFKLHKSLSSVGSNDIMPCFCKVVKFPVSKEQFKDFT